MHGLTERQKLVLEAIRSHVARVGYPPTVRELRTAQTFSASRLLLMAVAEGDRALEVAIHRHLSCARVRGEWFSAFPELVDFVMAIRNDPLASASLLGEDAA